VEQLARASAAACLCLLAFACGNPSSKGEARKTAVPGIRAVLRFSPPADGLLTEAELDRHVRVRRAARGRSEEEAARAVGVDPEEDAWVRSRVVETLVFLDTAQVRSAAEGTYARTIAAMRQATKSVKDSETLRRLNEQIALLERERANLKPPETPAAAVAANARRVARRRTDLETPGP
jgi:hypothetical protein